MEKIEKFKKNALTFPDKAKRLIVHNNETLTAANGLILTAKDMLKEIAGSYDPIIKHAQAEKKKYSDPLKEGMGTARLHVTSYLEDQAEIQRKADEEARKIEEERQKKEDDALERAKKYQDQGMEEEADEIIEEIPLPAQVPEPPPPKPPGMALKQIVDTEKIDRLVTATRGRTRIPGIEIYVIYKWKIVNRNLIPKSYYKSTFSTRATV